MPGNGKTTRVNVASDEEEPQLRFIRELLDDELTAGSRDQLEQALSSVTGSSQILDLVCHSTANHCFLKLNRWTVDWNDPDVRFFFKKFGRKRLTELGVKKLRLIGCGTATTPEARHTMVGIANALGDGIEVFGTTGLIYGRHFDSKGFKGARLVSSRDVESRRTAVKSPTGPTPRLVLPRNARVADVPFDLSGLRREPARAFRMGPSATWLRVAAPVDWREQLTEHVRPAPAWELPGLLTIPLMELFVPLSPTGTSMAKIQVLFRHDLVRVYRPDRRHGLIYRVKSPGRLASVLAASSPV